MQALNRVGGLKVATSLSRAILTHIGGRRAILGLACARGIDLDLRATVVSVVGILLSSFILSSRIKQSFSFGQLRRGSANLLIHIILETHLATSQIVRHHCGRECALFGLSICSNRFSFTLNDSILAKFKARIRHLLYAMS